MRVVRWFLSFYILIPKKKYNLKILPFLEAQRHWQSVPDATFMHGNVKIEQYAKK